MTKLDEMYDKLTLPTKAKIALVVLDGVASCCGDVNGAGLSGVIAQELQSIEHDSARGTQGVLSIDDGLCTAAAIVGDAGSGAVDGHTLVERDVLLVSAGSQVESSIP